MAVVEFASAGRLSEPEYRYKREALRATYGDRGIERTGAYDQAIARLFFESGWTQQQLATAEGKTQQWVAYRLRFGRFLGFTTVVVIPKSCTERRFRSYWARTDPDKTNERERFIVVQKLMEDELTFSRDRSAVAKRPIAQAILAKYADGVWHRFKTIVDGVGAPEPDVLAVLTQMLTRGTYHTVCERRKGGASWSYRIVRGTGKVDVGVLVQELGPIVQQLEAEGRKHLARWSPGTIARLAHELKAIVERLTHEGVLQSRRQPISEKKEETS